MDFSRSYRVSVPAKRRCEVLLWERMEEIKKLKYLGTVVCQHRDGKRNKRKGCERLLYHRVTCKGSERKEYVQGGKEGFKEQYSPANTDI